MENNSALIVVHLNDERSFIPKEIQDRIRHLISLFPTDRVYYTPYDQNKYPINDKKRSPLSNKNIEWLFFVGCNTMHDACVASQIRLLNKEHNDKKYKNFLVKDALFEECRVDYLKEYLKDEDYDVETIKSTDTFFK